MIDRHDTAHFLRFGAQSARRFRKVWTWAAPVVAFTLVLADPRGVSLQNAGIAALIVAGVWVVSFAVERLNAALADVHSDSD